MALIAGLLLLFAKKNTLFTKIQVIAPLFILVVQIMTLGTLLFSSNVFVPEAEGKSYLSTENLFSIGEEENIVVFVLDAFDGAYMEEIFEAEPEKYETIFEDFTYYTNVAAGGAATHAAMPIIITGEHYPGNISYDGYVENAFNKDGLYTELHQQGYSINLYTESEFVPYSAADYVDNLVTDGYRVNSYPGITQKYSSLTAYKYMPHLLKRFFWIYTGDFSQFKAGGNNGAAAYASDDVWFYETMVSDGLEKVSGKNFHLIHTTGAHPPYDMNELAQRAENVSPLQKGKGQLYIIEEYLRQMKDLGVYDNTTVIITSDHGQATLPRSMMLIKKPTETGFAKNDAPISHFDLHNTLFELIGKEKGDSIFDIEEGSDRIRMFYQHSSENGTFFMAEHNIVGNPKDVNNCISTNVVLRPKKEVRTYTLGEQLTFGMDGTGNAFLEEGVSAAQHGHGWTNSNEVLFKFQLDNAPKNDMTLSLTYSAAYLEINDQRLGMYVDDTLLYEEVVTTPDSRTITIDIPAELAADKELSLKLSLPDAKRPADVFGPGHDSRQLGLALTGLCIEEIDLSGTSAYTFGEKLTFGANATVTEYVKQGISSDDTQPFAFTDGHDVLFRIPLKYIPKADMQVTLNASSVLSEQGPQQVRIFAGTTLCYDDVLDQSGDIRFTVSKDDLRNYALTLKIVLPNAVSPYAVTGEGDRRILGLAISGLCIEGTPSGESPVPGMDDAVPAQTDSGFSITDIVALPLTAVMKFCYNLIGNYGLTIIVFTFLSKIILLPISIWVHKSGITMVRITPELNRIKIKYFGDKDSVDDETQALYKREKYNPIASTVPMIVQIVMLLGVIGAVKNLLSGADTVLNLVPTKAGGLTYLMPVAAGAAALALGLAQNKLSPLQREQSPKEQWMANGFSISISLFLGAFVSLGVGIYWVASNLLSIVQQMLLNAVIRPEKYIDYAELERSKKELASLDNLSTEISKEDKQREKADYKRFFSIANKHLVIYSEKSGFYKYYKDVMDFMLRYSNVIIHYVTNDPKDQIFKIAQQEERIKPYYISEKKLITLLMKMDADMVVMTCPDLDRFHLKRSYVRKDIEYVYMFHYPLSTHMVLNNGALDHYDSILCVGDFQFEEIRAAERLYNLPEKKLISAGYGQLEQLYASYQKMEKVKRDKPKILIAPSWQQDNLLDSCLDPLMEQLLGKGYELVIRPHPEYVKRYKPRMDAIVQRYCHHSDLTFELDFTSNNSLFDSDILISDWSGSAYEFSLVTLKPAVFINTPPKINNPEYDKLNVEPLEFKLRSEVGIQIDPNNMENLAEKINALVDSSDAYAEKIRKIRDKYIANFGRSGEVGGKYILGQLLERQNNK